MGVLRIALAVLGLWAGTCSALPDAVFADGYEPPCYGIANDRPGCIVVPFNQAPLQPTYPASTSAAWNRVDVYALVDRSGSMSSEITTIRNNLATVVANLRCQPLGNGTPGSCIDDLWAGAGTFSFSGSGADTYRNFADIQPNPNLAALPVTEPAAGCCAEATWFALFSTITGDGGTGCPPISITARTTCAASPAGADAFGYACFRPDAGPIVVLATDEQPSLNFTCPDWTATVKPQYLARGARVISAYGTGATAPLVTELAGLATDTGAVDALSGNAPIVVNGADTTAATAIQAAINTLRTGAPMDVHAELVDDPGDAVDVAAFVQRIEVVNDGSGGCPNAAPADDGDDGDVIDDTFTAVLPGTKVCFRVVVLQNASVPATGTIQFFPAKLKLVGNVQMTIAEFALTFAVPASG